ncbi:Gfo/Idh/MocA family protein [Deinococcus hopiensis]|uniref:Predicted dehydrogenase n=1 Tax=Deinococcus hopiensis KR-140 TaxID=695939 RepID=A0A1W1UE69_9DEIO|nr:Gfo/Idh/MocA family oxidoreductase [Deinococcus hopiensis]SMB79377.1 Predicted dehydrogenase [Deinococcus hopiensis KR-140]
MRVGIVGSGSMGWAHARAWHTLGVELAVHSRNWEEATRLASLWDARVSPDLDSLLAEVDVVDVCLPTFLHRETAERAARAGCHVVCEKPLALAVEDAEAMFAACDAAGVRLFVAMVLRFFPQYRAARELVRAGQIGEPRVLRLKRVGSPPHGGTSWFGDEARSGGVILDLMLHDIDYALWTLGEAERVYARSTTAGAHQYAQAVLTHRSGASCLIEAGWAYPDGLFRTGIDLAGTSGLIEWSSDAAPPVQTFHPQKRGEQQAVALPAVSPGTDPFVLELGAVLAALKEDRPFEVTPGEALGALRTAFAIRESARTGRAVTLGVEA